MTMTNERRDQLTIDEQNARFWDELCGSILAVDIGVTDRSAESLRRYDRAYMDMYPYLERYLPSPRAPRARVLEIGLGYGTVAQALAERGWRYHGLDIAEGPVEMARHRLRMLGDSEVEERVVTGSVHEIPHEDASLDA